MFNRIKYVIYRLTTWMPDTINDKIDVLLGTPDINIYIHSSKVNVSSVNVIRSIYLLKNILSVKYNTEYAVKVTDTIPHLYVNYIQHWYSDTGVMLDNKVLLEWLRLYKLVNIVYVNGLRSGIKTKAYRNSIKIQPLMIEGYNILNVIYGIQEND